MSYQRIDRISEEVRREVDRIIREELNDPRISGTFSVTRAEVTRDLRYAKVYVSVLEDDKRDDLMKALKSASGYIRRALGKQMLIRYSPEMSFVSDQNIAYGVHIAKVLADAQKSEGTDEHGTEEHETEA
ncbi:MAG: 30S ribosome-binding factor RbfA [Clostridia bacterium]|nr:30S ribosome-binding factor RbfA [Clostridia bacterium]